MAKNELNFEELTIKNNREEHDYLEMPISKGVFILIVVVIGLAAVLVFGRVTFLNVLRGDFYQKRSFSNAHKVVDLPAPRGIIRDRFGKSLVENQNSFSVFASISELLKKPEELDKIILKVSEIFRQSPEELRGLIEKANIEKRASLPLARNISVSQTIALKALNFSAIEVTDDYTRKYPNGLALSHVVGYTGVSEENNEIVGKAGLEAQYDEAIRGRDGEEVFYRDALGQPLDKKVVQTPSIGQDLKTTLDADLQVYFYNRIRNGLAALGREAGVGIAMNPQNGEILALVSLPSFDSNQVAKYLTSPGKPLFNRAVSGLYPPGSAIKPLVALAALKEEVVDPKFQIFSKGFIEIPNPYDSEKPSRFLDWKAHGLVDLRSAIARSSNVYFYEIGGGFEKFEGLGINRLNEYWKKFLLGEKTGIDLPAEGLGFLPEPEEKEERTGEFWRIGDTYNVSIGQGDLLLTPIQLLNFIASVANGGKIYEPKLLLEKETNILFDYSDWTRELTEVQEGMKDAVRKYYGTANLLSGLPVSAAGKTGSAQVANNARTNAFFVGYAPAENPQIAVLVLVENAREGSLNAVPIANDVLGWYYYNRMVKGLSL